MANEKRSRTNLIAGALSSGMTVGDTVMSSAALADLAVIDATNHAAIILFVADSNGRITAKEIIYVTAHTAAATTATVARGQEGTVALAWASASKWVHAATAKDFDGAGGGSGLIAMTAYNPGVKVVATRNSLTFADLDATNLAVTFVAPPSGKVMVRLSASAFTDIGGNEHLWNLRDAVGDVAGTTVGCTSNSSNFNGVTRVIQKTGLTPGTTYTWKWGWAVGTVGGVGSRIQYGGNTGAAVMEVWAVNV